jgi:hypothetical protein
LLISQKIKNAMATEKAPDARPWTVLVQGKARKT